MPEAPATKLADRIKESLAPLLAFADRFKSRYASFYGGVFAQVQRLFGAGGDAAAGGALASPASLAFARTGSVDSYRQRRRIERQGSDSLPAIAKKQVSVLEGIRGVMEEVKEGLGGMLKPANLFE